jgi:hypothetical protein
MARVKGINYGLRGIDIVMNNLHKEMKKYEIKGMKGLLRSAILIRQDMENTPPKIPVDTGNLRASWFIVTATGGIMKADQFKGENATQLSLDFEKTTAKAKRIAQQSPHPLVVIGFGANYAWFVHENVGQQYKRPGSGAKFFEAALNRNTTKIIENIRREM